MIGRTVGNYRIVEQLGAGGMGVVYKAHDTRLNRFLALKFLKSERLTEDFKHRFFVEARTASALNHPGIVHIYDVGQWEGLDYIAMEFVEGSTVQKTLLARRLPVEEAMRIAVQVAGALIAAHAAGIVHRDLKPGNVMVTADGLVKVLDFGLAKVQEADPPQPAVAAAYSESESTQTAGYTEAHTLPGTVFGSPPYMSPEQALGKVVDARSDIFAFGSLLYEMLTGEPAFRGATKLDVLAKVLHVDPPPAGKVNPEVPKALSAVVARCLHKDPEQRYQSMIEVRDALESMTRARAIPHRLTMAAVAAALLATAAAAFLAIRGRGIFGTAEAPPAETVRLTNDSGLSIDPAISPDGTLMAYASDRGGEANLHIWVRQVAGGEPHRATTGSDDESEPDFSPDGTQIVFRSARDGGGLYMAPAMGGRERKIAAEGRRPKFSPDGSKIAYWTGLEKPFPLRAGNGKSFILDLATMTTRQVRPDFAAAVHPVWSPDGKQILFMGIRDPGEIVTNWWITPLEGGTALLCPASASSGPLLDPFVWRGDRVYFKSATPEVGTIGEARVDSKTGRLLAPPRRLTTGTSDEWSPAVSLAGTVLFASVAKKRNVYSLPLDVNRGEASGSRRALTEGLSQTVAESVSADGKRMAMISDRAGNWQVWVKDLTAGREWPLTAGGEIKTAAVVTPDGNWVAWREDVPNGTGVFLTAFDGDTSRRLCADCASLWTWTPEGRFGLITRKEGRYAIGILDAASGNERSYLAAADVDLIPRSLSADGKWLAFSAHRTASDFTIYVAPFSPDRPPAREEWVEVVGSPEVHPNPHWSPDGGLLYFSSERDGYNCLWAQRLDRGTKKPVGALFAVRHFHERAAPMTAPSFWLPVVLAPDAALFTLEDRSGQIWMLRPAAKD